MIKDYKMICYYIDNDGHFFIDKTTKKQYVPYWIMKYGELTIKLIPIEDEDKVDECYIGDIYEDMDSNTEWGRFKFLEKNSLDVLRHMVIEYENE
jgi:hypothetical protein